MASVGVFGVGDPDPDSVVSGTAVVVEAMIEVDGLNADDLAPCVVVVVVIVVVAVVLLVVDDAVLDDVKNPAPVVVKAAFVVVETGDDGSHVHESSAAR